MKKLNEIERDAILETLEFFKGNKTHACKALGLCVRSMRDKCKIYKSEGFIIPERYRKPKTKKLRAQKRKRPSLVVSLVCEFCQIVFKRKVSDLMTGLKRGQRVFYCCPEHQHNSQYRGEE